MIVAGGRDDNDFVLSTESFAMGDSSWTKLSAELPYSFNGARAVKFDNNILLFGKWKHEYIKLINLFNQYRGD